MRLYVAEHVAISLQTHPMYFSQSYGVSFESLLRYRDSGQLSDLQLMTQGLSNHELRVEGYLNITLSIA